MPRRSKGEGTIWQDERGRYVGRIIVDGQARKVYGRTRTEAARKLKKLDPTPPSANIRFSELLERYLDLEAGRAEDAELDPSTLEHRRYMLARFASLGKRPLDKLTSIDVRRVLDAMAAKGYARSSIKRSLDELARVLEWARNEGITARNVAKTATMPRGIVKRDKPGSITREEFARLRVAAKGSRIEHALEVAVGMCLRPGELLALRWCDVDFEGGTVRVEHSLEDDGSLGPPKTERSRQTLKATPSVMAALAAQRSAQVTLRERRLAAGEQWANLDLCFPTRWGTPMDRRNFGAQLEQVCRLADLEPITPNELRHTGASLLLDQGMNKTAVSRFLRHTSTRMLDSVYGDEIAEVIDIGVEDVLAPLPKKVDQI